MTTPIYGFPYPSSTDLIRDAATDITDLAIDVEDTLDVINGLVPIIPTGTSQNITFDDQGIGTPAIGQSSFTIGGCFGVAYDVYRILWTGAVVTADAAIATTYPGIVNGYYGSLLYNRPNNGTATLANNSNGSQHTWTGRGGANGALVDSLIITPAQTGTQTMIRGTYIERDALASAAMGIYLGTQLSTASVTSITLSCSSGVIATAGRLRIWAYNK